MPGRGKKPFRRHPRGRDREQGGRLPQRSPSPPSTHYSRESSRRYYETPLERSILRTVEQAMRRQFSRSLTNSRTSRTSQRPGSRSPARHGSRTLTSSRTSRRSRSRSPREDYCSPRKSCQRSRSLPRSQQWVGRPSNCPKPNWWRDSGAPYQGTPRLADPQKIQLIPVGES